MGFFKGLADKAKNHIEAVKSNVSKQDLVDMLSDVSKDYSKGDSGKALGKMAMGLGKMAMNKYEGSSRKLDNAYKDPYDMEMAENAKSQLNEMLTEKLDTRKFLYGDPVRLSELSNHIVGMLTSTVKTKEIIPAICKYLDSQEARYDRTALEKTLVDFRTKDDVQIITLTRDQVDKYVFLDRMTIDEILAIPAGYMNQAEKDRIFKTNHENDKFYYCKYCGARYNSIYHMTHLAGPCSKSPDGKHHPYEGLGPT